MPDKTTDFTICSICSVADPGGCRYPVVPAARGLKAQGAVWINVAILFVFCTLTSGQLLL